MSLSRDANVANSYAGLTDGLIIRVAPGSKGIDVSSVGKISHDQEVVSGGKYEVVGKSKTSSGRTVVDVRQVETHKWQKK